MNFLDVVSAEDQKKIEKFITSYASRFEGLDAEMKCSLDYVMRFWERAKNKVLYQLLGENLVLEKDYSIAPSTEELRRSMRRVCEDEKHKDFIYNWEKVIESLPLYRDEDYYSLLRLPIATARLVDNKADFSFKVPLPDNKVYKIERNTKAIRAIGKIAEAYNIKGFEEYRLDHSRVLNTPKDQGKLVLSIHPLDYITMSENSSWHSCMNWRNCGEYRQGTVEMMNSPHVIVAYFYTKEYDHPCGVRINDKKWRKLFLFERDMIVGVRGYPCEYPQMDRDVMEWIRQLAMDNFTGCNFEEELIYAEGYDGETFEFDWRGERYTVPVETRNMYNDFYYSHPLYVSKDGFYVDTWFYSGESECLLCGDPYMENPDELACDDCDSGEYCEQCEEWHPLGTEMFEFRGCRMCEGCFNAYVKTNIINGEREWRSHMSTLYYYDYEPKATNPYRMSGGELECAFFTPDEDSIEKLKEKFPSLKRLEQKNDWWENRFWAISREEYKEAFNIKDFDEFYEENLGCQLANEEASDGCFTDW